MDSKQNSQDNFQFSLTLGSSHTSLVAAIIKKKPTPYDIDFYSSQFANLTPKIQILGATRLQNNGAIKKGIVSSIESLSHSILEAIDEVERQTGLQIKNAITCIPCMNAQSNNYTENYNVKNIEIRQSDIEKINNSALNISAPAGHDYIHTIPGLYSVDGNNDINNPVGMQGSHIALNFHRVCLPRNDLHNIARSCYNAGIQVNRFIYEPLSAAEGALTKDEKEFGCISISIGTYITHVVVYLNNYPVYTKEFAIGSHHITKDLAIGLRTTQSEAERIKKDIGKAYRSPSKDSLEKIEVVGVDEKEFHTVTRQDIINIIQPRIDEILETVYSEIKKTKLHLKATKGIILSGGGALLNGISIATERIYGHHARIANPISISGATEGLKSPIWTTSIGAFSDLFIPLRENQFNYKFNNDFTLSNFTSKVWKKFKTPFF